MKIINLERIFIIGTSLALNKLFLFWLIGASNIIEMVATFVLLILNFMVLAKSVDKIIDAYEESKKKQARSSIKEPNKMFLDMVEKV